GSAGESRRRAGCGSHRSPRSSVRDSTQMSTVLEGKAALVTGAAGGIGSAVVCAFAEAGAQVLGVDRVEADYVCDVTRSDEVKRAVGLALERRLEERRVG